MPLVDALLPEFDREMALTRKVLERIPDQDLGWQPHQKSWPLGTLATHVARIAGWATATLAHDGFNIDGESGGTPAASRAEVLVAFDAHVRDARAALVGKTDAELLAPWTLKAQGHTVFTMPKTSVLRSFVLSHLIHHRGQLTVYLRLRDVPVPSIYGPSADESM